MNAIKQALEDFLNSSTPEQLQAELKKGNRPYLQTLADPVLMVAEHKFSFPAKVSFCNGQFAQGEPLQAQNALPGFDPVCAANQEMALAA